MIQGLSYVGSEVKWGGGLYVATLKKVVLHPLQTIKDMGTALVHPVTTIKNIFAQVKEHPLGMTVNFGLSWATGHVLAEGVELAMSYHAGTPAAAVPLAVEQTVKVHHVGRHALTTPSPTTLRVSHAGAGGGWSTFSQIAQTANLGGCGCGGVCTIGQTGVSVASPLLQKQNEKVACCTNSACCEEKKSNYGTCDV